MKNNNDNQITQSRSHKVGKARVDTLVIPVLVEENTYRITEQPPRRRRRINYEKKILNDPFLFSA